MDCLLQERDGRLWLEGELTIYAAPRLKEELLVAVRARCGEASVDLSGVTELDTAGVQLLLMARRISLACGSRLRLVNPSAAAREVLGLCGLTDLVATPPEAEAAK